MVQDSPLLRRLRRPRCRRGALCALPVWALCGLLAAPGAAAAQLRPPAAPADPPAEDAQDPSAAGESVWQRIPGLRQVPTRKPPPGEAGLPPVPDGVLELDLQRAVTLALARNPALQAVEEQIDEVIAGIEEARADAFPQIDLAGSWSRTRNPAFLNNPDFEDFIEQFPDGDFEPSEQELWSGSAEVSQPLYTFGKIRAAIELARLAGAVVEAQIEAARLETALVVAETYYQLLAAEQAVGVVEAQQRARRAALDVVEARYDIGEATRLALLRSRSSLAELGPLLAERRGDVRVAASNLRLALGLPPGVTVAPDRSDRGLSRPLDLEPLIELAFARRPELADLRVQRQTLEKRQQISRSDGLPQIEFDGRYGRQVRLPENFTDPLFADWSVVVGMRWELFDGGRRKGQIAQLESQRQQLGWRLEDLENRIVLDIETALARYSAALERLQAAEVSAETAWEASRVAAATYREGVTLQADLLDAQQREVAAEIELVDAVFQARIEAARLARAVGDYPTQTSWAGGSPEEGAVPVPAPPPLPEEQPDEPSAETSTP